MSLTRKQFLVGAAAAAGALAAPPVIAAPRRFVIHLGHGLAPDHPGAVHALAAAQNINKATNGEVDVMVFPSSQLGDDTHMMSNLRSGAMQMLFTGDNILSSMVPAAAIDNLGFAFKDAQTAWKAVDGKVGDMVSAEFEKAGLHPMRRIWDEGFRQITSGTHQINTPEDLHGFKIRVPASPIQLSMFQCLGAAPLTLNLAETYTALQTHVADGQENPLGMIDTQKFYQVQKYCSLTNHVWVGHWMLVNGTFWKSMPKEHQTIVEDAFNAQALEERVANEKHDDSLEDALKSKGMEFARPDLASFQAALTKSGFYKTWQDKFGTALWAALESYTGPLA
jgi:tripartite ATP-independent transporter DctP family solute receptor